MSDKCLSTFVEVVMRLTVELSLVPMPSLIIPFKPCSPSLPRLPDTAQGVPPPPFFTGTGLDANTTSGASPSCCYLCLVRLQLFDKDLMQPLPWQTPTLPTYLFNLFTQPGKLARPQTSFAQSTGGDDGWMV